MSRRRVRSPRRRPLLPPEVAATLDLPTHERALAAALATDGTWLVGTRDALLLVGAPGLPAVHAIAWARVQAADWNSDDDLVRVSELGDYGRPRPEHCFEVSDPGSLLQLVRERVTASIVLQRRVPVHGRTGFVVIGRRSPQGGPISWMHEYDAGLDPSDPEVAALAERALVDAQAEVG